MLNHEKYLTVSEQIADDIINHPICQQYVTLQQELKADSTAKQYIDDFEKAKAAYADVERYGGKYHPDYKVVLAQLIQTKTTLFEYPLIQTLKQTERELQQLLSEVSETISSMSFFEKPRKNSKCGCQGNCSHEER